VLMGIDSGLNEIYCSYISLYILMQASYDDLLATRGLGDIIRDYMDIYDITAKKKKLHEEYKERVMDVSNIDRLNVVPLFFKTRKNDDDIIMAIRYEINNYESDDPLGIFSFAKAKYIRDSNGRGIFRPER
jgi:hypothetical protein